MRFKRKIEYQCAAIVQPGEYVIDLWDDKQCQLKGAASLIACTTCGQMFCFLHWPKHYHKEWE